MHRRKSPRQLTFALALAASGICACLYTAAAAAQPTRSRALESSITEFIETSHIAGLAAAAFDSGEIVWIGTAGLADVERNAPVTADTLFQLASITKPLTATVLLTLYAGGAFDLDDDINEHLPFRVRNPNHPETSITVRELLRHRSSIADNGDFYQPHWSIADGDPTLNLGDYLEDYLTPGGAYYSAERNFHAFAPDESSRYCNTCYALVGYLAESIAGQPFEALSANVLFGPLGMSATAWFLRDLDGADIAMPYRHDETDGFVAYGHNGYPDWPAGQLRSSVRDFAGFLAVYANGGADGDGRQLIDAGIVDTLSPVDPHLGFHTWFQLGLPNTEVVYSHDGADLGTRTSVLMNRARRRGVVVLSNGEVPVRRIANSVYLAIDGLIEEHDRDELK